MQQQHWGCRRGGSCTGAAAPSRLPAPPWLSGAMALEGPSCCSPLGTTPSTLCLLPCWACRLPTLHQNSQGEKQCRLWFEPKCQTPTRLTTQLFCLLLPCYNTACKHQKGHRSQKLKLLEAVCIGMRSCRAVMQILRLLYSQAETCWSTCCLLKEASLQVCAKPSDHFISRG